MNSSIASFDPGGPHSFREEEHPGSGGNRKFWPPNPGALLFALGIAAIALMLLADSHPAPASALRTPELEAPLAILGQ